jgi:hypothetical protein
MVCIERSGRLRARSEQIVEVFAGLLSLLMFRGRHPDLHFGLHRRYSRQRRRLSFQLAAVVLPRLLRSALFGALLAFDQFCSSHMFSWILGCEVHQSGSQLYFGPALRFALCILLPPEPALFNPYGAIP